jgi:hypothetical protein
VSVSPPLPYRKEATQTLERQLLAAQKAPRSNDTISSPQYATIVTHLHAQAVVVQDVRSLITIVMDLLYTKYPR